MPETITITPEQLYAAYAEWERGMRAAPETFISAERQAEMTVDEVAKLHGDYLMWILAEQSAK